MVLNLILIILFSLTGVAARSSDDVDASLLQSCFIEGVKFILRLYRDKRNYLRRGKMAAAEFICVLFNVWFEPGIVLGSRFL